MLETRASSPSGFVVNHLFQFVTISMLVHLDVPSVLPLDPPDALSDKQDVILVFGTNLKVLVQEFDGTFVELRRFLS